MSGQMEEDRAAKVAGHRRKTYLFLSISIFALAIGATAPLLAFVGLWEPRPEMSADLWFQRSGAISVAAAIVIGIFIGPIRRELEGSGFCDLDLKPLVEQFHPYFLMIDGAAVVMTLLGTAISGYGDLLFVLHRNALCGLP